MTGTPFAPSPSRSFNRAIAAPFFVLPETLLVPLTVARIAHPPDPAALSELSHYATRPFVMRRRRRVCRVLFVAFPLPQASLVVPLLAPALSRTRVDRS